MKFLCPNCKAKYQISDEKISGRTLKMDCRRCNHPIVIRGDKAAAARRSKPSPKRQSFAGPRPTTSKRNALGADFRSSPQAPPPPQERPSALDQWHVAINDVPVGPMKRDEIARKIATGAVLKDSLCWREGMDDWRPLKNVPELSQLLRHAAPPAPPKRKPPLPPPPSRPLGGGRKAARPATGRQKTAQPRRDQSRPAARGNVVPIGGRLGAAAAPALDHVPDDFEDDDPTTVGSMAELQQAEAQARRERERQEREREEARDRRREKKDRQRREREEREARELEEREREEREREAARQAEREAEEDDDVAAAPMGLGAEIAESDAFDPFAEPASSAPGFAEPPPPAEAVPVDAAPAERRRRAIPIGAWIAIAGAASFGVVLAIMVGTHYLQTPPQAAVAPPPAPEAPEPDELEVDPTLTEVAEPDPEEPDEADPEATEEVEEPEAETGNSGGANTGRATQATTTGGGGAATRRRAEDPDTAARFDRFADNSSDSAPNLGVATGGSTLPGQERSAPRTELTSAQVTAVVRRERSGVQRCYETYARQSGQAPAMRVDVDVTVGGSGAVTRAVARGQSFGTVSECIERTIRRWHFPRTGTTNQISIPFVFTGRD